MKKTSVILLIFNCIAFSFIIFLYVLLQKNQKIPHAILAPHISMETLTIQVGNFDEMKNFYSSLLGMEILSSDSRGVLLGFGKEGILHLISAPQLPKPSSSDPGLDQIAIVFASRPGLAKALKRVLLQNPTMFLGGTSRGAIGEAFYVVDPAGNTLELYYDTDPSTWPRSSRGNVEGNADPIDTTTYINTYAPLTGDMSMKIGHLQIRIGDIRQGKQFYVGTLGLYIVPQLGGNGDSLFLSDGFYHHDLVINQAQGYDGDTISHYQGLVGFEIGVPDTSSLSALKKRLAAAHIAFYEDKDSISFMDPWGIAIRVRNLPVPFWQSYF